jgi:hypothetical protein
MKARFLKPGQVVTIHGRPMTFVKRLRAGKEIAGRTENVFICEAYRGLNGPGDDGRCTMSDQMFNVLSKQTS